MAAGHVPIPIGARADVVTETFDPWMVVGPDGTRSQRHDRPTEVHPELGLLLSTSGSTGAPKLVRLSHRSLVANAAAIAEYLGLTPDDRAITTLPMTYCYGLSVLHSHLRAGASIQMSDVSVTDARFRSALAESPITGFAGVPHTFELLAAAGFDDWATPALRYVTQAGGRLPPDVVRSWATRGRDRGWDFYVMYGQTEATARMAYLPPASALLAPESVGVAVPGGSIRIRLDQAATADDGIGEVVYAGPNVMMGYASTLADLERGAELTELCTGDLGRIDPRSGMLQIVGRVSRFVKPFGLRIDLDAVERRLAADGIVAAVAGDDALVVIAGDRPAETLSAALRDVTGLPASATAAVRLTHLPRTSSGKVDSAALLDEGRRSQRVQRHEGVAAMYAATLGLPSVSGDATFVTLGGDSLSYIESRCHLDDLLTSVPDDWHLRRVDELEALRCSAPLASARGRLDTTVALRAVSILCVVATHMGLLHLRGGAHLLLAVSGFNFARFVLAGSATARCRLDSGWRLMRRLALPASAWIALNWAATGSYGLGAVSLVNNYFGDPWRGDGRFNYWFVEVSIQLLAVFVPIMAIPSVRRAEERAPFGVALVLASLTLAPRLGIVHLGDPVNEIFRAHSVAWIFMLGWLAQRARAPMQRLVVVLFAAALLPGFFGEWGRECFVIVGIAVLVATPTLRVRRVLRRPASVLASASFGIYLTHFQLWPLVARFAPLPLAFGLTVLGGIAAQQLARRLASALTGMLSAPKPWRSERRVRLDELHADQCRSPRVGGPGILEFGRNGPADGADVRGRNRSSPRIHARRSRRDVGSGPT